MIGIPVAEKSFGLSSNFIQLFRGGLKKSSLTKKLASSSVYLAFVWGSRGVKFLFMTHELEVWLAQKAGWFTRILNVAYISVIVSALSVSTLKKLWSITATGFFLLSLSLSLLFPVYAVGSTTNSLRLLSEVVLI